MEIKTEQCHEHFTEEEQKISAQIRSVATTLYERVDLDKPTVQLQGSNIGIGLFLLLFNRSSRGNIQ